MRRIVAFVLLAGGSALAWADDDCAFRADRSLDLDPKGLSVLKLDTGAGELVVEGVAGLAKIELRGKACASAQETLESIQFSGQREGTTGIAATMIPESGDNWSIFGAGHYAYMDVHVRMPSALKLDLRDSSGDLDVSGLTNGLDLKDSSGDIRLHDIVGAVNVTDTSGDIEVKGIGGDFTVISDSSGDINVDDVKGSAVVQEDSSGDITLRHVAGDARVDRDSSGDITFEDVGRDAVVGADGSGDITADGVKGNFTVGAKSGSSGEIHQRNVGGKVTLPPQG